MNTLLIILAVLTLATAIFFAGRWLRDIWRIATMVKLLRPEVLESTPFYKLVDILLFGISHAMERHGPVTTIKQHMKRAKDGVSPDGIQGDPVHSGRWNSFYSLLQAVETATQMWEAERLKKRNVMFSNSIKVLVKL